MRHLQAFMGRQDSVARGDNISQALNLRWKLLLSNLVYAISSQDHPIALVFEDLHWANEDTLDTIQMITLNTNIRHCLFCMSYHDATTVSSTIFF
ncbi:hypothetical protein ACHAWO_007357 [Cyclotella atomus]|uniref:Orc1-like AAA ATPase domain-containing protein n=1 Tax=Cyclotella atomus TaxID=382360 RepID=A0ABD3NQT2_9STRA